MADKDPLEIDVTLALQKLYAQTAKAEARLQRMGAKFENDFRAANTRAARSMDQVQNAIGATGRSLSSLRNILIGALSAREIVAYADAWTVAENKIAAAAQVAGISARSLSAINDIATETRASIGSTADLYAKLLQATKGVAKSEQEVARATAIVNKAFKAGGAAASEQAAGILQLAQALSSGVLQGDELRSLRENAPLLAKAIADAFGVTVGQLKDLGAEGQLTADKVFGAILAAQPEIEAAFAKTNATIGEGFTRLRNALTEYIGRADDTIGATRKIADALTFLAENIDGVVTAATILGASFLGRGLTPLLASLVPLLGGATAALAGLSAGARATAVSMTALRGAIGLLGGPVGVTLAALVAIPLVVDNTEEKISSLEGATRTAASALDAYAEASKRAAGEQEELGGKVTASTQAMLLQERSNLRKAVDAQREELGRLETELSGFLSGNPDFFRGVFGSIGDEIATALEDLKAGSTPIDEVAAKFAQLTEVGGAATEAIRGFDIALADSANVDLEGARQGLVAVAEQAGIFAAELAAIANAKTPEEVVAAYAALRLRLEEAARAGEFFREGQGQLFNATVQGVAQAREAHEKLNGALEANTEELELSNAEVQALVSGSGQIDFSNGAATAAAMADQLNRAAGEAQRLAQAQFDQKNKQYSGRGGDPRQFLPGSPTKFVAPDVSAGRRGGSGGGGGSTTEERPFFEVSQEQIDRLNAQISAIGQTAGKTAELYAKQELLNEAKRRGLDLDAVQVETGKTLRQEIDAQAATIGRLTDAYDAAQERAQFFKGVMKDLQDGIVDAIVDGESFIGTLEGIARALAKALLQAALFGQGPLATLWGGTAGTGLLSGLFGGFDKGGFTGPGGKYEPAGIVHKGEYVFSADAVKRIGVPNLEAMHKRLRGFASGGMVGSAPAAAVSSPASVTVEPVVKVVVINDRRELGEYLQSAEGERAVVAALRKNRDAL